MLLFFFFFVCNSVKIGQNFQNKVSVGRYILAHVAAYILNSLNAKLNGIRKENRLRSIQNKKTTTASSKG